MIVVIANIQYDFGFEKKCADPAFAKALEQFGVEFKHKPLNEGIDALQTEPKVDVLIVDYHSKNCCEDIVQLCRNRHPETKIVTINHKMVSMDDEERELAESEFDYALPGYDGHPNWFAANILEKFSFINSETAEKMRFDFPKID